MADEFALNAEMTLDTSGFIRSLNQSEDAIRDFQNGLSQMSSSLDDVEAHEEEGNKGLKSWGIDLEKFTSKGKSLLSDFGLDVDKLASKFGTTAPMLTGIVAVTSALAKLGEEMDEARKEIAIGTGAIGDALNDLEKSSNKALVRGVGTSVKKTGKLIADLNTRFASTGKELEDLAVDFGDFAQVTGVDLDSAVNNVADVMARWDVPLENSKDLMNQLAKASQLSGASVDELMSSVKQGQTYFQQFGYNLTESVALLSSFKRNGIQTETVMAGLRTAMAKFSAEGRDAKEAFAEVTKRIKDTDDETEALNLAVETFGNKAGPEMFNAIRKGSADVENFTEELRNAGTTIEDTSKASRTSKDAMTDLTNALKGTFGGLGQAVTSIFKNIIDSLTEVVRFISPLITPIVNVIKKVVTEIAELVSWVFREVNSLMNSNASNWSTFITILNDVGEKLEDIFGDFIDIFKQAFGIIFDIMGGRWESATIRFKLLFLKLARAVTGIADAIANIFIELGNKISEVIGKSWDKVSGFFKNWIKYSPKFMLTAAGFSEEMADKLKSLNEQQLDAFVGNVGDMLAEGKLKVEKLNLAETWVQADGKTINQSIAELEKELEKIKGTTSDIKDLGSKPLFSGTGLNVAGIGEDGLTGGVGEKEVESIEWLQKRLQQQLDLVTEIKEKKLEALREEGAGQEKLDKLNEEYAKQQIELFTQIQNLKMEKDMESLANFKNAEEEKERLLEYYAEEGKKYEIEVTQNKIKEKEKLEDDSAKKIAELKEEWENKTESQKLTMLDNEEKMLLSLARTELEKDVVSLDYTKKRHALEMERLEKERESALLAVQQIPELVEQVNAYYDNEKARLEGQMALEEKAFNEKQQQTEKTWKDYKDKALKALKTVSNAIKNIGSVMKSVMGKVVSLTKKGFSATVKIFTKLFNFDNDEMLNNLLAWEDKVLTFFVEGAQKIPAFVSSALQSVRVLTENILGSLSEGGIRNAITNMIESIAKELPVIIKNIAEILTIIFDSVVKGLKDNIKDIVKVIVQVIKSIIKQLPVILPIIIEGIISLVEGLLDVLEELVDDGEAMETLENMIASLIQQLVESGLKNLPKAVKIIVKLIVTLVKAVVKAIVSIIRDTDWSAVWGEFKRVGGNFVSGIWDGIKAGASWLWDKIKSFFSSIWDWISGFFSDLWEKIKQAIQEIIDKIKGAVSGAVENVGSGVSGFFENIGSGIKSVGNKIVSGVKSFFGFANGTDNAPRGVALVGEEGPELVRFHGGEQVVPAPQTRQILGGGNSGSVFNVTFNNTQDTTAFAMMKQMKGWQRSLAFNAVI